MLYSSTPSLEQDTSENMFDLKENHFLNLRLGLVVGNTDLGVTTNSKVGCVGLPEACLPVREQNNTECGNVSHAVCFDPPVFLFTFLPQWGFFPRLLKVTKNEFCFYKKI